MVRVMRHLVALALLAACGDDGGTSSPIDAPAQAIDAAPDAPPAQTCTGACRTTALTATFGTDTRVLDRAYYGVTTTAAGNTLHVEAYRNAPAGCPTSSSATPDYTLILGKVGIATPGMSPGNILDFKGDLLDGPLGAAATTVSLQTVAVDLAMGYIALDATLTFAAGSIAGHLFATHCASLDETQ